VTPSVLRASKLARVFVAPNGNDGNGGGSADKAVKSIDRAISLLQPGGTVVFQAGTYAPLKIIGKRGASGAPIRIEASGQVEFRDKDYKSGAGILIRDSQYIEVVGMRTRRSLWGIYMENSHHVTLRANDVGDVGQEGIRIKAGSSNVRIDGNTVADTGRRTDKGHANGEGIYIGTGTPSGVDHVKNIVVINNRILRVTDEAIDVKRPATNIDIIGNSISDVRTQTSGAIVVHLSGDQSGDPKINIERNVIRNVTRSSPYKDGNCIVSQVTIRIVNNVLHNCEHRGIFLKGSGGTATVLHNTLISTGSVGQIVNEGRGMRVVSENNLGAGGEQNRQVGADAFVNAGGGNYQLKPASSGQFKTAPNKGVSNDLSGSRRPGSGPVTFGAVEASGAAAAPATTRAPTTTAAPRTTSPPATTRSAAAPRTTQPARKSAPKNAAPRTTTTAPKATSKPGTTTRPTATLKTAEATAPQANQNDGTVDQVPSLAGEIGEALIRGGSEPPVEPWAQGRDRATLSRSVGEPSGAAAGPFTTPGEDEASIGTDSSSCFSSLTCLWAPFL